MDSAFVERAKKKIKQTPTVSKKKKAKTSKLLKGKVPEKIVPGTVYVGHLPHGFYEDQLRKYFSQFGKITKLRVARSRKTGRCKGFAFIQFEMEEVAKVVAEAMNNYMFFEKLLRCQFIPSEQVHPSLFLGWRKSMPVASVRTRRALQRPISEERLKRNNTKRKQRLEKLKKTLAEKGVKYKMPNPVGK